MPRLASVAVVFAFILLPLLGCGLLEPTSPPPEAIKLARTHGGLYGDNDAQQYEFKDIKVTFKKKQLSDADKFNGMTEEWDITHDCQTRIRNKTRIAEGAWRKWEEWEKSVIKATVIKVKGEWKTKFGDGSIR